jgi:protein gp37
MSAFSVQEYFCSAVELSWETDHGENEATVGKNTAIEWTHHTFNPWWGCTKVSEACDHCYAATFSHRLGYELWGVKASRRFFTDEHWHQPLLWNQAAIATGERRRVFCASMADVFEARKDLNDARARLWDLIIATPSLDWLLLTKRPHKISNLVPWKREWPQNVWIGTTVEHYRLAKLRIEALLAIPAVVHFLSCEPLLSRLDLSQWIHGLDWIIAGGESGANARQTDPAWFRSLRDQCVAAGVAFHFKQWGNWRPSRAGDMERVAKKLAGRILDDRTWDEYPSVMRNV